MSPLPLDDMRCRTCSFFMIEADEAACECWRYPPVIVADQTRTKCVRPSVRPDDFCGEYIRDDRVER